MTTIPHDPVARRDDPPAWTTIFAMSELWASLAIAVMWIAVLFASLYAPDIVTRGVAGDTATIPSGVVIALFATFATWAVAKYGYRRERRD
jgi:hypothetical protein